MAIVKLYDIDEETLSNWAMTTCPSFQGWLIYENSESWMSFDSDSDEEEWAIRYEFEFADDQEALLFQLKWQGL